MQLTKNKLFSFSLLFFIATALVFGSFSIADAQSLALVGTEPGPSLVGKEAPVKLLNPLCKEGTTNCIDSVDGLVVKVVNIAVGIGYAVAAFFLLLSGFRFVTAQGNEEKLKEAKNTFKYTIIGTVLIVGFNVVLKILGEVIGTVTRP